MTKNKAETMEYWLQILQDTPDQTDIDVINHYCDNTWEYPHIVLICLLTAIRVDQIRKRVK